MKIKNINPEIKGLPATKAKPATKYIPAQRFTTYFGGKTFIVTKKTKVQIDFMNVETKEIHHTTPNDDTIFFLIEP